MSSHYRANARPEFSDRKISADLNYEIIRDEVNVVPELKTILLIICEKAAITMESKFSERLNLALRIADRVLNSSRLSPLWPYSFEWNEVLTVRILYWSCS
jgi:hypothetical protein